MLPVYNVAPDKRMKSQAIVFTSEKSVAIEEIQLPDPRPQDLVVRTFVSGVSVGTERWALIGKRPEIRFPNVPGYMGIGEVLEAGAEARKRGYREGQLVNFGVSRLPAPWGPNSWMGTHLSAAVVDACTGVDFRPGGFNLHRCDPVPEGLDPLDASITPLCGVALRGIEMARIPLGGKVLVLGVGAIGQFAAQVCRLLGARVAASDVAEERLEMARRMGADWTLNAKKEDLAARAREIAPDGFDVIIDTSSIPAVVNGAIGLLKMYGQVIFQGWYPPPSSLDLNEFHGRLPTCYFPCAHTGKAVATAMRWVRDGKINARGLITHVFRPEEAERVYGMVLDGREPFLALAFDWRK